MTRVFLTSSHLSSILAAVIAEKISKPNDENYLIIDHYYKKEALILLINQTQEIFKWKEIVDLSIHIENVTDLKPSFKKTLLRKIKTLPVLSGFYKKLLVKHNEKYAQQKSAEIKLVFNKVCLNDCNEIFLLTQTALNAPLLKLFPTAKINYYEHGIGDYYYFYNQKLSGNFYGLFAEEFSKFIDKRQKNVIACNGNFNSTELESAFKVYFPKIETKLKSLKQKKCILFLMDALEGYNPPNELWTDYLKASLEKIPNYKDYCLIIKPHPNQSNGAINATRTFLIENKLDFLLLDDPLFVSMSVEIVFVYLRNEINFFVSTFSSAIFYLAKFFPENCEFILMYEFVEKYLQKGPKQYLSHYYGLKPYVNEIFMTEKIRGIKN